MATSLPAPTMWDNPNTIHPHQPGYERPDRSDDYQPEKPIVAAATSTTGTPLEQATAAMEHAAKAHGKYLGQLEKDRHRYSDKGFAEQAALFGETAAAKAVDRAVDRVQERFDQAQAHVDKVRADLTKPGDAAQESRNTRYWNRSQPLLDKSTVKFLVAEELLNKASRDELSVLLDELPAYLELNMGPMPASFKHQRGLPAAADWAEWIDATYVTRAVPEYGRAKQQLKKARQALDITNHSAQALRRSFTAGRAGVPGAMSKAHKYDPDK